jgi:hypothetical protein
MVDLVIVTMKAQVWVWALDHETPQRPSSWIYQIFTKWELNQKRLQGNIVRRSDYILLKFFGNTYPAPHIDNKASP